jgi:glycogen debranching enzyme
MLAAGDDNAGENAQPTDMIREFSPAETMRIKGETGKKPNLYYRRPFWYDALSPLMQFTQSVAALVVFTVAFHWFRLKIEATLLVAVIALTPIVHELYHIISRSTVFR